MIQVSKFEMHSGADRNAFGNAAYAALPKAFLSAPLCISNLLTCII